MSSMQPDRQTAETSRQLPESEHFHPKRSRSKRGLLWALVAFLCVLAGVVIGAGLTVIHFRQTTFPRPPNPDEMTDRILTRLKSVVTIQPEEDARIRDIVQQHMDDVKQKRKESWESIREQFSSMREEVGTILGPERKEAWVDEIERSRPQWRRDSDHDRKPGDRGSHHN